MKKIILILIITISVYGYSEAQLENLNRIYNIGLQMKKKTGMSFEKTLCAIALTESSAGVNIIGDQYTSSNIVLLVDSSLGIMQERLVMIKELLKKDAYIKKYYRQYYTPWADTLAYMKIRRKITKLQDKLKYEKLRINKKILAKQIYNLNLEFSKYHTAVNKDLAIMGRVLVDTKFSVILAHQYLSRIYNIAKKGNMWNPYFKAVSKYNGGWKNVKYFRKVNTNIKEINKLIKKGLLHRNVL